ncbi:CHAT domain-containing protein [Synechococcales cyanobacterium C]|uniref:CHAT domain-containing protein n=1 Tax=Petrachloros mirabilis ULC683 TaxID=2781853 RepID=A0A8K2A220_9CYAN|nr:CHAT domain-containing protein [Petrachloros mirabilis]NCJ08062.1 CHAT domain-containing protein [Petrachloros mirabilis ULC683]
MPWFPQSLSASLLLSALIGTGVPNVALAQFSIGPTRISPRLGQSFPSNQDGPSREFPDRGREPSRRRPGGSLLFDFRLPILTNPRPQPPTSPFDAVSGSRTQFESRFQQADPEMALRMFEALQIREYERAFDLEFQRLLPGVEDIARTLAQRAQETGQRGALVQIVVLQNEVHLLMVPPQASPVAQLQPVQIAASELPSGLLAQAQPPVVIRQVLTDVGQARLQQVIAQFRREISDPAKIHTQSYRPAAQQLYQWLVAPLEPHLRANQIDTLLFSMDDGLRTTPMAALHDGQQFLIQKYGVALLPSFGWTETRKINLARHSILAMGISEGRDGLAPLPAVPVELHTVTQKLWQGQGTVALNEASTLENLRDLHRQTHFGIIHLATHAELMPGAIDNSFIQFWDDRLTLRQLRQLSKDLAWNTIPAVELLVLSACDTALGSKDAELGFAGSALNAGVRSTVASLWAINDRATLGLMSHFYAHLRTAPTKSEAMRQTQLAMLSGEVQVVNNQLRLASSQWIALPPELVSQHSLQFAHPYFWSGYTVIGNWN